MATKRLRAGRWEYRVARKGPLPKPIYLTFSSEAEGDEYVTRLEALLDRGVVPPELVDERARAAQRLHGAIKAYRGAVAITVDDAALLEIVATRVLDHALKELTFAWAQAWITSMKRLHGLSLDTIRHHVGALP